MGQGGGVTAPRRRFIGITKIKRGVHGIGDVTLGWLVRGGLLVRAETLVCVEILVRVEMLVLLELAVRVWILLAVLPSCKSVVCVAADLQCFLAGVL